MAETSAPKGGSALDGFLARQFQLTATGTTVRTELVAAVLFGVKFAVRN